MKKMLLIACTLLGMAACNSNDDRSATQSDNDIDAARNFIRSALDGDYDRARLFMVNDSLNQQDLNAIQRLNERLTKDDKEQYRSASIRIHETRNINDSASVIIYSNSYKNKRDSLKVVRDKGQWLVDFKYIFKNKGDSLP